MLYDESGNARLSNLYPDIGEVMDDSYEKMTQLAQQIAICEKCQLHLSRKKSVPGEGNIHSKILFIGRDPV
jgi:uracil-DNA glycosylase